MNPIKLAVVISAFCTSSLFGDIIYVDSTAPGGDGTSWMQAFTGLQDAFDVARDNGDGIDEIWVAGGTYLPTYRMDQEPGFGEVGDNPRAVVFVPRGNVEVYGGFAGDETERNQRDFNANPTIISGDLNGDDLPNWQNREDNAYVLFLLSVVDFWVCSDSPGAADVEVIGPITLDGITIRGGYNNSGYVDGVGYICWRNGPGVAIAAHMNNNEWIEHRLTVQDCIVIDNFGDFPGNGGRQGIVLTEELPITFERVLITENWIESYVMKTEGNAGLPSFIRDCTFARNGTPDYRIKGTIFQFHGKDGGTDTNPEHRLGTQISNCRFIDNHCTTPQNSVSVAHFIHSIRLNNCIFAGNSVSSRGIAGFSIQGYNDTNREGMASNCLVTGNYIVDGNGCGGVVVNNGTRLYNCIIWGNDGTDEGDNTTCWGNSLWGNGNWHQTEIRSCLIQGLDDGTFGWLDPLVDTTDCFDADPMLMNPWGNDGIIGTEDDDYRLGEGSPCIDRGNNDLVLIDGADLDGDGDYFEPLPLDYNYSWRFMDVTTVPDLGTSGNGYENVVDLGPLEVPACPTCPGERFWVNANGGIWSTSLNWYPAKPGPASDTVFDLDADYTVLLDEDAFSKRLLHRAGNVSLDMGGHEYELNDSVEWSLEITGQTSGPAKTLSIENGALRAQAGVIAPSIGASGIFDVLNKGIITFERGLTIGRGGSAEMNVNAGGYVLARDLAIGDSGQGSGRLNLNGGTMDVVFFSLIDKGTLALDGGTFSTGYLETVVFNDGLIEGEGNLYSDVLNFGGIVPSDAMTGSGELVIYGDYEQLSVVQGLGSSSGELKTLIGSVEHSELVVMGMATLGGGLVVETVDGYEPSENDEIRIVSCDFVEGQFDVALMPGLPDGKYMKLGYGKPALTGGLGGIDIEVDVFSNLLGFDDPNSVPIAGTPTAMTVDDFDGDGNDDVAITLAGADGTSAGSVLIMQSDGAGGFSSSQQITVGANPQAITAGDFDNDGHLDLAIANAGDDSVSVLENLALGDGAYNAAWDFSVGRNPRDVEAVDLNGDGVKDLAVVVSDDDAVEMWVTSVGARSLAFGLDTIVAVGDWPNDIDPGDVNDDKVVKMIVSNREDGSATVLTKGGTPLMGSWSTTTLEVGNQPMKVKMEDLNADGFDDAVVSNYADGTVSILLADGATNFLPQVALPVGDSPLSLAAVDFDNDGDQDIALVATNSSGDRVVQVLRNDLDLTGFEDLIFASATELGSGENPAMVGHGDMDGDGLIDLVTVSEASTFRGESNSVIATRENTQENINTCDGDFNNDGEVKIQDLLIMIAAWGECEGCTSDLNADNMVNVHDLLILIANWGPCT